MIPRLRSLIGSLLLIAVFPPGLAAREYYQEPAWQPRAHPTLEDILSGKFHPAPPPLPRPVTYNTPGYAAEKLHPAPATGVYPRVLVTPEDVAAIRARVAQGDSAPPEFRGLWRRIRESRTAFSALVARDDALGSALAARFMERVRSLQPKLDRLDARPDRQNLWSAERSLIASQDPEPPSELWTLLDYDYLHGWLSPEDRALVERTVARLVRDRISNFLCEPDHFMINNHKGFGMEFIRLMLLIEGRPDFPDATFRLSVEKVRAMLDWYLSPDGMCYESIKGWLNTSAFVAAGRRNPELLRHDHLVAKMRFFQSTLRREGDRWIIREEMRASAFHVIWLMRFLYPEDRSFDFLYHASLSTHPFITDPEVRWPDPVGVAPELLLLLAGGGPGDDRAGKLADWETQPAIDSLNLPLTWKDDLRGYVEARNSWRIGDLHLGFHNKQDFYYGGHEGSEANRLVLWKDGVNWLRDEDLLAVKATGLQNMLTIDGRGLSWPPVPGVWLGVNEGPHGLSASGDARLAYRHNKVMQVHPLAFPSGKLPYYAPFTEKNFDLQRDLQIAFHPGTVAFNDGYAHTDYGPWSGETRLVEFYGDNQPDVKQAYRTVHLARGPRPYILVLDDAATSGPGARLFETAFNLPDDAVVVDAKTTEVQFQNVEPALRRESEFIIAPGGTPRDPVTGLPVVKKGDPLLLVRILYRNTDYGYPVPSVQVLPGRPERPFNRFTRLVVPAVSTAPGFRVLFYPHRSGDPLPVTAWNHDRSELSVTLDKQQDRYRFAATDGGRTVFDFTRDGMTALANPAAPARPVLLVRGDRFDANELRTTRREGVPPAYPVPDDTGLAVAFERVPAPAEIRYTLDGSEPAASSPRFDAPFTVRATATLRARIIDPSWPGKNQSGAELTARFDARPATTGLKQAPDKSAPGLLARIYEINTKLWDDRGFFRASKVMLPDLDRAQPLATAVSSAGFALPHAVPAALVSEQAKGFYRFTGWFRADAAGVHDFAVDSCGPVLLAVAGQDAIAETGVFHQNQAVRRGSAVLGAGWHPIELTVTDPQFWNLATRGLMPFAVTLRGPADAAFSPVSPSRLAAVFPADARPVAPALVWKNASPAPGRLVPGVVRSLFERDGLDRDPSYLEIDDVAPRRRDVVDRITDNDIPAQVAAYEGWFEAPVDGVYVFDIPAQRPGYTHLGSFRHAYQSQLGISGEIVLQRGVSGRLPDGRIGLKAGWHPISLRLGSSVAALTVTYPDGQTLPVDAARLRRPAETKPPANSPDVDTLAAVDFAKWDGCTGITTLESRCRVWVADFARSSDPGGRRALLAPASAANVELSGVDINMTRGAGRVPLKLHFLKMRDAAFTIGGWFRSDTADGLLFGKQGLTAFGKSYRTVSVGMQNGRLQAEPGRLSGGTVTAGVWHHVVLSATPDRLALYLDGKLVDEGQGAAGLPTDALDFLPDHPGAIASFFVENRELTAAEVSSLHAAEKR